MPKSCKRCTPFMRCIKFKLFWIYWLICLFCFYRFRMVYVQERSTALKNPKDCKYLVKKFKYKSCKISRCSALIPKVNGFKFVVNKVLYLVKKCQALCFLIIIFGLLYLLHNSSLFIFHFSWNLVEFIFICYNKTDKSNLKTYIFL